jgi:hypothetical protein
VLSSNRLLEISSACTCLPCTLLAGGPTAGQRAQHPRQIGVQRHGQLDHLADYAHHRVRQRDEHIGGEVVGVVGCGDRGSAKVGVGQSRRRQPAGRDHVVHGGPGQSVQHLGATTALRRVEPVSTFQLQRQQRHQIARNLIGHRLFGGPVDQQPGPQPVGAECVELAPAAVADIGRRGVETLIADRVEQAGQACDQPLAARTGFGKPARAGRSPHRSGRWRRDERPGCRAGRPA